MRPYRWSRANGADRDRRLGNQDRTRCVRRSPTSGCAARLTRPARESDRRCSSHASTSSRSQTTQRGVRLKRRGNSPRGEITGEKLVILRKADAIYLEEIRNAALRCDLAVLRGGIAREERRRHG